MGGPNADVAVDESIHGMRRVLADVDTHPGGGFYDFRGQALPW
jgi:hypothetical protein